MRGQRRVDVARRRVLDGGGVGRRAPPAGGRNGKNQRSSTRTGEREREQHGRKYSPAAFSPSVR